MVAGSLATSRFRGRVWPRARGAAGLASVVVGALLVRLLWLTADAPASLSWSGAPWTDEGLYSHVARSYALWHAPPQDGWNNRLVSPLWDLLALAAFRVVGVGYVALRLASIALTLVALAGFWLVLRREWGAPLATLGAALWAFDYYWIQYSRLGLLEPGLVCWLVLAALCWCVALDRGMPWAVLAGMCAGVAWIWKSLALLWLPAPLLALLIVAAARRHRLAVAVGYLTGLGLTLLAYMLVWYLPQRAALEAAAAFYAAQRVPQDLGAIARQVLASLRSPFIVGQTPVLLVAGLLGAARALWRLRRGPLPPPVALGLAWLGCGVPLLALPYNPPRYFVWLVPALVWLALWWGIADNQSSHHRSPHLRQWWPAALLGLSLLWSGWWYAQWARTARATLITAGQRVDALVPPGELILGVHACGLSLAHTHPCAPLIDGLANDRHPVEALGAHYALVEAGNPDDYLTRHYPALLRRARLLARLEVGPRRVLLYSFDARDGPAAPDTGRSDGAP